MVLTQKFQLAVIMIKELIRDKTSPVTIQSIADKHQLSRDFLDHVAKDLKAAGMIMSKKGPGGGYILNGISHTYGKIMEAVKEKEPLRNKAVHVECKDFEIKFKNFLHEFEVQ